MVGGCGSEDDGEEIREEEEHIYFITTNLGVDDIGSKEEAEEDHGDNYSDGKTGLTHPGNLQLRLPRPTIEVVMGY
jgi:hypothetical protein